MTTTHTVHFQSAASALPAADDSVALVVTSPPYPMIEMWDESFGAQDARIADLLAAGDGARACEAMHRLLDPVWRECLRVLRPGGFACINIGDATRSLDGAFHLYTNHARITVAMEAMGFESLPAVLWRKQTNAPNKFMGSGMLPAGAYVTLEHEYILVFRKGRKREIAAADKERRRRSAFFWEERNAWFSDLWDLKGTRQRMADEDARRRSGAYPFELPFRLINMYSMEDDLVLDPFAGTGTTTLAAIACGRSSVGVEIDARLESVIERGVQSAASRMNERQATRLRDHSGFVARCAESGRELKHENASYGFPVMTRQETELRLPAVASITRTGGASFHVEHVHCDDSPSRVRLIGFPEGSASIPQLDLDF